MWLEHLNAVVLVKLFDRVVRNRVFQVAKNAGLTWANLDTSRLEPAGNAMVAKRAFLGGFGDRIQKPAAVRAGLNAKAATDAIIRIDQHRAIRRVKRGAHRADLNARRVFTKVAKFRNEERLLDFPDRHRRLRKAMHAAVGRMHNGFGARRE